MEDLIIFLGDEYYCTECGENFTNLTEDGCCPYCGTEFTGNDSPRQSGEAARAALAYTNKKVLTFILYRDIIYIVKELINMSWNETRKKFLEQFKDYKIKIVPPCISLNRQGQYVMEAQECAIGKKCSPFVTIDHDKKEIIYKR